MSALLKLCFHIDALDPWDHSVHPRYHGEVLDGRGNHVACGLGPFISSLSQGLVVVPCGGLKMTINSLTFFSLRGRVCVPFESGWAL